MPRFTYCDMEEATRKDIVDVCRDAYKKQHDGELKYYKDLAFPTASLVFCLLGVPVGIVSKRSGRVGGFAVGVLIIIVFYVLNVACDFLVTTMLISPFVGAWMPNIVFIVATIILFMKMSRQ